MTKTKNKSEEYLTKMYASVDRMNEFCLRGDLKSVEQEKKEQRKIKKMFFNNDE